MFWFSLLFVLTIYSCTMSVTFLFFMITGLFLTMLISLLNCYGHIYCCWIGVNSVQILGPLLSYKFSKNSLIFLGNSFCSHNFSEKSSSPFLSGTGNLIHDSNLQTNPTKSHLGTSVSNMNTSYFFNKFTFMACTNNIYKCTYCTVKKCLWVSYLTQIDPKGLSRNRNWQERYTIPGNSLLILLPRELTKFGETGFLKYSCFERVNMGISLFPLFLGEHVPREFITKAFVVSPNAVKWPHQYITYLSFMLILPNVMSVDLMICILLYLTCGMLSGL